GLVNSADRAFTSLVMNSCIRPGFISYVNFAMTAIITFRYSVQRNGSGAPADWATINRETQSGVAWIQLLANVLTSSSNLQRFCSRRPRSLQRTCQSDV